MVFIVVATTWPRISEWLLDQKSTLGPTFYNAWLPPLGARRSSRSWASAPLLGWRKTSPELFRKSFRWPLVGRMVVVAVLHVAFGKRSASRPSSAPTRSTRASPATRSQKRRDARYPFVTIAPRRLQRRRRRPGVRARHPRAPEAPAHESCVASLFHLVAKSAAATAATSSTSASSLMFLGFTGRAWGVDKEVSLKPGETHEIEQYMITYAGPRMEVDQRSG